MNPFPSSHIPKLMPIFQAMLKESNLQGRASVEHWMARLYEGTAGRRHLDIFADDIDNPQRVVILGRFPGIVTMEDLMVVFFMYSVPELRGLTETHAMIEKKIKEHAAFLGVDAVIASDWCYQGSQMGVGSFLRKLGFERQEVTYVYKNPLRGYVRPGPTPEPQT